MATNTHARIHQQPAVVEISIGKAEQVVHSGVWMLRDPETGQGEQPVSYHSEQLLIDQACLLAFEQVEPEFDGRPVEVAYRAVYPSARAACEFVNWMGRFDERGVWCDQSGYDVLLGFHAPLDKEMLLKASLLVHYAMKTFGGIFEGWGLTEPGMSWMTVKRVELEGAAVLH